MKRRRTSIGLVTTSIVVVVTSVLSPTWAWARYGATTTAETNTFATHVFVAPGEPSCGLISLFSVPLSWTAPSDAAKVTSYDVGKATTSGGPYTFTNVGNVLSDTVSAGLGNSYYVVRSEDHLWRGANSPERHVLGLALAATCP